MTEYFVKNFRMDTRTFEDFLSWVAPVIQEFSSRRSTANPAERLSCTDWISLGLLKHQKTIDHKTFFFFITVLIVRAAAKFLLLFSICHKIVTPVLFLLFLLCLNFLLPMKKLLSFSIRLIKLVEKENFLKHRQKILDKFHVAPRCWKPSWKKLLILKQNLIGY